MITFVCPACRTEIPMRPEEFPLKCRCGRRYASQADAGHGVYATPLPMAGPGSELAAVFQEMGIKAEGCSGCGSTARQMDVWGVAGCRDKKADILTWLKAAYDFSGYLEKIKAGTMAVILGLPKTLEGLLELAIERAQAKANWDPIRNCLYHVCPLERNDLWLKNVKQLLKRSALFTGRKVAAIAVGPGCLPPSAVREAFAGHSFEFLEISNDPKLREVATFLPLLETVANRDPNQVTFYAHTKGNEMGTTGPDPRWVQGSIYWRNSMYAHLLDNWEVCRAHLRERAAAGCHLISWSARKQPYPSGLNHGNWMFAGTFFWFRNDRVFSQSKWNIIPADRYGAEAWLSGLFAKHEVSSVFQLWQDSSEYVRLHKSPYDPDWYTGEERREDEA